MEKISAKGLFYCDDCDKFYSIGDKLEELPTNLCLFCQKNKIRVVMKDPSTKFKSPSIQIFKCGNIIVFQVILSKEQKIVLLQ